MGIVSNKTLFIQKLGAYLDFDPGIINFWSKNDNTIYNNYFC